MNCDAMTATIEPPAAPAKAGADQCGCGHADKAHDVIAKRFCAATHAQSLTRGCICAAGRHFRSPP